MSEQQDNDALAGSGVIGALTGDVIAGDALAGSGATDALTGDVIAETVGSALMHIVIGAGKTHQTIMNAQAAKSINDLRGMIDAVVVDDEIRERLRKQLNDYETASGKAAEIARVQQQQEFDLKLAQENERLQQESERFKQELEVRQMETKTQRIVRLLDRDLVSVIIGGVLLIILTCGLVPLVAFGTVDARLIESAFLVLLGFFFGQGTARIGGSSGDQTKPTA